MKTNNYAGIDPHIVAVIERELKKIVGRYGITAADVPDIEQELHLKVWRVLSELKNVAFEAAVCQIVKHAATDMIRGRECQCRDWRRVSVSLNAYALETEDPDDDIGTAIDLAAELDAAFGRPAPWHQRREMEMDLEESLGRLPRELRDLAETLDVCEGNLSEAARMLGVTRKKARVLLIRLQQAMAWLRDA